EVHLLHGGAGSFVGVTFSPDGRQLAAGTGKGTLLIWDIRSGRALHTLTTHGGQLSGLAYSPDGERLATAGFEVTRGFGQLKLWDAVSGKELLSLPGQMSVAFSADGRLLTAPASGSLTAEGTVNVWDAAPRSGKWPGKPA